MNTHSKAQSTFASSVKEKRAIFEKPPVSRPAILTRNLDPITIQSPLPPHDVRGLPSSMTSSNNISRPFNGLPSNSKYPAGNPLLDSRQSTRRVTAPIQRKVSVPISNVKHLVNKFEAKLVSHKQDSTRDEPIAGGTSLPLSKKGSNTKAIRANLLSLFNTTNFKPRHSQPPNPKRLSTTWLEENDDNFSVTCSRRSSQDRPNIGQAGIDSKRSSLISDSLYHPQSVSTHLVDTTQQQFASIATTPSVLLDELPFTKPSELNNQGPGSKLLTIIQQYRNPRSREGKEMERGSGSLNSQQGRKCSSTSGRSVDLPNLTQYEPNRYEQPPVNAPRIKPGSTLLSTIKSRTSASLKFSSGIDLFTDNQSGTYMAHPNDAPTHYPVPTKNLIPLSGRVSLPNFPTTHLHHATAMSIPFPSFEDDEEYTITERTVRSSHDSSRGTHSTCHDELPTTRQHNITNLVKETPTPNRKSTHACTRSFLIGRRFDVDNDSLYGPQSSTDDENFFRSDESPTAKGLKWRQKISFSRSSKCISTSKDTPAPMSGDASTASNYTSDRHSKIKKFSLHKLSGPQVNQGSPAGSMLPSTSTSPEDIRKAHLGVERCGGIGNKMFESGIRQFKRIVTAPVRPQESSSVGLDNLLTTRRRISFPTPPRDLIHTPSSLTTASSIGARPRTFANSASPSPYGLYKTSEEDAKNDTPQSPTLVLLQHNHNIEDTPSQFKQSHTPSTEVCDISTQSFSPLVLLQHNHNIEDTPSQFKQSHTPSTEVCDLSTQSSSPNAGPSGTSPETPAAPDRMTLDHNRTSRSLSIPENVAYKPTKSITSSCRSPNMAKAATSTCERAEHVSPDSTADSTRLDKLFHSWRLLCHEVQQELKLSQERWPDTEFSKDIMSSFVRPSNKNDIIEFLIHSQQAYAKTFPTSRRKPRSCLKSAFSTHDITQRGSRFGLSSSSSIHLGLTPPPKHPFGSKPGTPILPHPHRLISEHDNQSAILGTPPSATAFPVIVTLPVPSAFVSPARFQSPAAQQSRPRKSRNSSIHSNAPHLKVTNKPGSKRVDRLRTESMQSNLTILTNVPLRETSPNVSPSPKKKTVTLVCAKKVSTPSDINARLLFKKDGKQINPRVENTTDSLPSSYTSSNPSPLSRPSPKPVSEVGSSVRKAWKRGDNGNQAVHKTTSQSSFWDQNENSLVVEEPEEEETGVLVASGENSFASNTPLSGVFNPARSLRRFPSSRQMLMKKSSGRSIGGPLKKSSLLSISRM